MQIGYVVYPDIHMSDISTPIRDLQVVLNEWAETFHVKPQHNRHVCTTEVLIYTDTWCLCKRELIAYSSYLFLYKQICTLKSFKPWDVRKDFGMRLCHALEK